jgi:O-methyltransferase
MHRPLESAYMPRRSAEALFDSLLSKGYSTLRPSGSAVTGRSNCVRALVQNLQMGADLKQEKMAEETGRCGSQDRGLTESTTLVSRFIRLTKKLLILAPLRYSATFDYLNLFFQFKTVAKKFSKSARFRSREAYFAHIHNEVLGNKPIDYLEFGVYRGDSIKYWSIINRHPQSRLIGFDSFEGLPTDWTGGVSKGHFTTGGKMPVLDDPRVQFVKGWFQDSLPTFLVSFQPANRLVVHLDADLFTSTLYCLTMLHHHLKPGTLLMFDEFSSVTHEYRALLAYTESYLREFRPVALVGNAFDQVCVEITK